MSGKIEYWHDENINFHFSHLRKINDFLVEKKTKIKKRYLFVTMPLGEFEWCWSVYKSKEDSLRW